MSRLKLLLVGALVISGSAFADHDHGRGRDDADHYWRKAPQQELVAVPKDRVKRRLKDSIEDLDNAIAMARGNRALVKLLKDIRGDMDDLKDDFNDAPTLNEIVVVQNPPPVVVQNPPPVVQRPPPPPPPQLYPVTDQVLASIIGAIDRENFSDGKVRVVQQASATNYFLCAQVAQILRRYQFSQDRLSAAALLKPRILDAQNSYVLFSAFDYDSDKAKLKAILGN